MSVRRAAIAVSAVLAAGALAGGCGSGDDSGSSGGGGYNAPEPAEKKTQTSTSAATGDAVAVAMKDIAFVPQEVSAAPGQTVVWTNEEEVPHDVTADSGADFKSDELGEGETFEFTVPADATGEIRYLCTLHPMMEGRIKVGA